MKCVLPEQAFIRVCAQPDCLCALQYHAIILQTEASELRSRLYTLTVAEEGLRARLAEAELEGRDAAGRAAKAGAEAAAVREARERSEAEAEGLRATAAEAHAGRAAAEASAKEAQTRLQRLQGQLEAKERLLEHLETAQNGLSAFLPFQSEEDVPFDADEAERWRVKLSEAEGSLDETRRQLRELESSGAWEKARMAEKAEEAERALGRLTAQHASLMDEKKRLVEEKGSLELQITTIHRQGEEARYSSSFN